MALPKTLKSLSASSIRDFKNCPALFYYRHVLKLRLPQKQMNLIFGGAVHNGLEHYHDEGEDLEKATKAFHKAFFAQKTALLPEEAGEFFNHLAEGKKLITAYHDQQEYMKSVYGITPGGISEMKFSVILKDPITEEELGLPINGRIDRITGTNQVVEFKTAKKKYKQDETDLLDQATIYEWVTELETGKPVPGIFYVVLLKERKKDPIQIIKTSRSVEDRTRLFREAKNILKHVEAGRFPKGCSGFKERFCDCGRYRDALAILD